MAQIELEHVLVRLEEWTRIAEEPAARALHFDVRTEDVSDTSPRGGGEGRQAAHAAAIGGPVVHRQQARIQQIAREQDSAGRVVQRDVRWLVSRSEQNIKPSAAQV